MASQSGANTFTGANTFSIAPIDKTAGHPYITKDGVPAVPSTIADTTKDANFTGKLQQNGQDVATADDLKSINQNVLHRDSNSGKATDAIDFGPGKLTADGYQVGGMTVSKDKATAKSDSAAHPGTLFFY